VVAVLGAQAMGVLRCGSTTQDRGQAAASQHAAGSKMGVVTKGHACRTWS
jgi:hypothetical protein